MEQLLNYYNSKSIVNQRQSKFISTFSSRKNSYRKSPPRRSCSNDVKKDRSEVNFSHIHAYLLFFSTADFPSGSRWIERKNASSLLSSSRGNYRRCCYAMYARRCESKRVGHSHETFGRLAMRRGEGKYYSNSACTPPLGHRSLLVNLSAC